MAAVPAVPLTRGLPRGRGRAGGRGHRTAGQRPTAQVSAQGQQQRAAEVAQQIAAAAETVLGTSISPSQPLMDAGLDSLGKILLTFQLRSSKSTLRKDSGADNRCKMQRT